MPHLLAAIAARFFIGLEGGLGAMIALHFYGKSKWVLKTAFGLVVFFSLYLLLLWAIAGNNVNCGCFGDAIWMSPSSSLIKNVVLLVAIGLLIRYNNGISYYWAKYVAPTAVICFIACTYIFFPVFNRYKIDLTALYTSDKALAQSIDLAHGKHIIAFVSPSCIHCRKAALLMHNLHLHNPAIPFYMVIGGTTSDLKDFWKASNAQDLPYTRLAQDPFMKYTHGLFPTILWINDGQVQADTGYPELTETVIKKWMSSSN